MQPKTIEPAPTRAASLRLIADAHAALSDSGNSHHFGELLAMCEDEEKRHRRGAPYGQRFGLTITQAARLFVIRSIAQALEKPDRWTVADVLSVKASAIYAQSLVMNHGPQITAAWAEIDRAAVLALDYCELVKP